MQRLAFVIAAAALLVSAPRLAMAFLLADGVRIGAEIQSLVYGGTGIASGVVLTGGNIYLAHALAAHWKRRGGLWAILLVAWASFLAFAVILIAPALVYGLAHSVLAEVLSTPAWRWFWGIVAALSVEILAAASMAASVLAAEPEQALRKPSAPGVLAALRGAALRRIERDGLAPGDAVSAEPALPVAIDAPVAIPVALPVAPAPDARSLYRCLAAGCARTFATQQALAAHGRAHLAPRETT